MNNCYINGIGSVSAQELGDNSSFFDNLKEINQNVVHVIKPNYRNYIKPTMIRRMGNAVKYGVVASTIALQEANTVKPEAIITGTGMGCLIDSEKFLKRVLDYNEEFLTPTSFIQSTHNTVGAQIALGLQCKSYNVTYGYGATSFETTLIDALLMLDENTSNILVGGIDELGDHTTALHKLIKHVKVEENLENGLLNSNTSGTSFGEGADFFVLENKKTKNSYAKLLDVETFDALDKDKIGEQASKFLTNNNLAISDIDVVVLGNNGDIDYDVIYKNLQDSIFKDTQQIYYKHLSGEYNTVTAFGLYIASQILKKQEIPDILKLNDLNISSIKNILLYNQYRGQDHSFTLVSAC
jgi:3-oxoacyl-(acyl-carrier-protein) synthase